MWIISDDKCQWTGSLFSAVDPKPFLQDKSDSSNLDPSLSFRSKKGSSKAVAQGYSTETQCERCYWYPAFDFLAHLVSALVRPSRSTKRVAISSRNRSNGKSSTELPGTKSATSLSPKGYFVGSRTPCTDGCSETGQPSLPWKPRPSREGSPKPEGRNSRRNLSSYATWHFR